MMPRRPALRDKLSGGAKYVVLAHGLEREVADQIRAAIATSAPSRSPWSPNRCGSIRRRAAGRTRRWRRISSGSSTARAAASTGSSRPIRDPGRGAADRRRPADAGGQADPRDAPCRGGARDGPAPDHRCRPPAGVEQELLAAWVADRAEARLGRRHGPLHRRDLREATYPSYDANDYKTIAASDPGRFIDPMVSTVYEPGSVFKMMTAAAALEYGTVTPSTRIKDTGTLGSTAATKIDDADRKAKGWMTFEDAIA